MKTNYEWIKIGKVGVDSGVLMIGDPCYLEDGDWSKKDYDKWIVKKLGTKNIRYVNIPFNNKRLGKAVAFCSGYGDGCYDVFAKVVDCKDLGKRILEIKIKMDGA